jgi:hypothetical protein
VTTMSALQQWERCPEFIEIDDKDRSIRLLKCGDRYALRGSLSERQASEVEACLPGDDISIIRGVPPADLRPEMELLPVYAAAENTPPAVATERLFLSLRDDLAIDSVRDDIDTLGFDIDDLPAYAPHSAWLRPKSGLVVDALSKLERLRALPGAARVDPQLLRPVSRKKAP